MKTKIQLLTMARSGGNLARNLLKEIIGEDSFVWHHTYRKDIQKKIVIVRDVRDSLCSCKRIGSKNIIRDMIYFKRNYNQIDKCDLRDTCIIRYEDFINNYDVLFDRIEHFLNIQIEDRLELKIKYSLKNCKKISDKLSNWDVIDSKTNLHGNHIGNGQVNQWKKWSGLKKLIIYWIFKKQLIEFGYYKNGIEVKAE